MLANHFTAARFWPSIEKEGLRVYSLDRKFHPFFEHGVLAWPEEHDFDSELGMAIYHAKTKGCRRVVQIEIDYDPRLHLRTANMPHPADTLRMTHNLNDEGYFYHRSKELIVLNDIPAHRLRLVASYDMEDL